MHAFLVKSLFTSDSAGRFDVNSLSQQTRMELLAAEFGNSSCIRDDAGDFLPVDQWEGLDFDSDNNVAAILFTPDYTDFTNGGTVNLSYCPSTITDIEITELDLDGTIETASLPRSLSRLLVSMNRLKGRFTLSGLPASVTDVKIDHNLFEGSLDLENAPPLLLCLDVSHNRFLGTLNMPTVTIGPNATIIRTLDVSNNAFSGGINLEYARVKALNLYANDFSAETLTLGRSPVEVTADMFAFPTIVQPESSEKLVWAPCAKVPMGAHLKIPGWSGESAMAGCNSFVSTCSLKGKSQKHSGSELYGMMG